jgi:di/tricarboxylate transporter
MTLAQGTAFALIIGAIVCFAWGRFRYDVVSVVVLTLGLLTGVVPAKAAFSGFSSEVVVIIAAALIVSAAVSKSGVVEWALRPILPRLKTEQQQVPVLVAAVTALSTATKNVGALAILMPVPFQLARRTGTSPSRLLMPMSFGSLLGGLVTLVGTSTNILVSQIRGEELGAPFKMFDFAPVGVGLSLLGFAFLSFGYRLLPKDRQGDGGVDAVLEDQNYVAEAEVPANWGRTQATVGELQDLAGGQVKVTAIIRNDERNTKVAKDATIRPGDKVLLEGEQHALTEAIANTRLKLDRADRPVTTQEPSEEVLTSEAVVTAASSLNGRSASELDLQARFGANLIAISRGGARITDRIRRTRLRTGDVLVLQAGAKALPHIISDLGLLPLARREVRLGVRRSLVPIVILAVAMGLVAVNVLPVAVAFFAAAVAVVACGSLSMREAYQSLDGPVLVLIGALTPVSEAVRSTGGTELVAHWLSGWMAGLPPILALGGLMIVAMISSPFMHNAPTVLVLAPISISLAKALHLNPDPFLMGVAAAAGCDFLTPIGHQCNTLVMGPGGYKFGDYARLGAPLSIMVILIGTPLIAVFWPLVRH